MRYVTAFIGGLLVFIGVVLINLVLTPFLPVVLQRVVTLKLGIFTYSGPVCVLIGVALGGIAATHSFRSTLMRYSKRAMESPAQKEDGSKP